MKKIASLLLMVVLLATKLTVFSVPASAAKSYCNVAYCNALQSAIDKAKSGDELYVTVKAEKGWDCLNLTDPININKSLKIYFEIDAHAESSIKLKCSDSRAFIVTADDVELHFGDNLTVYGNLSMSGEAFYVTGDNCLIDGASIEHCGGSEEDGGAIYVDGEYCTIQNCFFGVCHGNDGGAIYVNKDDCHVIDCTFQNTEAYHDGGAIYLSAGSDDFRAVNCTFNKCIHHSSGKRGHYIEGDGNDSKIFNCSPHWGETSYYCDCSFESVDPLGSSHLHRAEPEEGFYIIHSALDPDYCLDIKGGRSATGNSANLYLYNIENAQGNIFEIKKDGDAYKIIAAHSGLVLDIEGNSNAEGKNIYQYEDWNGANQRWYFEGAPGGGDHYYIHSKIDTWMDASGCVGGIMPANETNVQSWSYTGALNQVWVLEKVNYNLTASTLSEGNIWIIIAVAVVVIAGVATLVIVKKKTKPALADGTDNTDEE